MKLPKIDLTKVKDFLTGRGFKHGANAVVLTLILLGIIWFVSVILSRHPVKIDTTANQQYTISPQTIKILQNVKTDVKIMLFMQGDSLAGRYIEGTLKDFAKRNPKITFEPVDVDKQPSRASMYVKSMNDMNSVVFESGTKRKDVKIDQIFINTNMNPYAQQQTPPEYQGEQAFINAILSITEEKQRVICFTEGHKEYDTDVMNPDGLSELKNYLTGENYKVNRINIAKLGKIPEDCDLLVIAGPRTPFMGREAELVKKYLENGGKAIIMVGGRYKAGLDELLLNWNIKLEDNVIVDPAQCISFAGLYRDPASPIPNYRYHAITEPLSKNGMISFYPYSRSVTKLKNALKDRAVNIEELLETSDKSWGETDYTAKQVKYDEGKDLKGPLIIAMAVTEAIKEQKKDAKLPVKPEEQKEAQFVVIGNADFAINAPAGAGGATGNKDFFINSVNWLLKQSDKISVLPKKADVKFLKLGPRSSTLIFYLTLFITPLLVLAAGVYVWWKRRSR